MQPRIKAGIAVNIVRECLAALAALHRDGIVHGDIKPSNIMLKRTGNAENCRYWIGVRDRFGPAVSDLHADIRGARGARR